MYYYPKFIKAFITRKIIKIFKKNTLKKGSIKNEYFDILILDESGRYFCKKHDCKGINIDSVEFDDKFSFLYL